MAVKDISTKKSLIWENVWKNLLVLVTVALFAPYIQKSLHTLDLNNGGNFLLIISTLLVTVCFANFGFTYKDSAKEQASVLMLSHVATFCFLLLMAILLLTMSLGIAIIYPAMGTLFSALSILLYVAIVLYDFWDLLRTN